MTKEDALALIFMSLHVSLHYSHCLNDGSRPVIPMTLVSEALAQLDKAGVDTTTLRVFLGEAGIQVLDIKTERVQDEKAPARVSEAQSAAQGAWNRISPSLEETVWQKFQAGWSKSQIAREFRLNRRTVIRICKESSERLHTRRC